MFGQRSLAVTPSSSTSKLDSLADAAPKHQTMPSGAVLALEKTGFPTSWLRKPKLPSRNWLIFWGVVSSLSYLAWDDSRKCKAIKADYISRVKHLAEQPLGSMDRARKVQVYACKWPGDDMTNRSMKHFKKYVKPILHAAAVDYEMRNGNYHGAISDLVRERVRQRREAETGAAPSKPWNTPTAKLDYQLERERDMQGGVVIIGRHAFKEYMHGLREGWTASLTRVDKEEALALSLAEDGAFDEPDDNSNHSLGAGEITLDTQEPDPLHPMAQPSPSKPLTPIFSPLGNLRGPPRTRIPPTLSQTSNPAAETEIFYSPPASIPSQPPFLFVEFPNRIGFRNIPMMIYDFFNERRLVKAGCEAAYRLVFAQTRPFNPPTTVEPTVDGTQSFPIPLIYGSGMGGDLNFDAEKEQMYGRGYRDTLATITAARKGYYNELLGRLRIARELARGEREPTKDEKAYPPPTEVELRAERLKKELRWKEDEEAYQWLRQGKGVTWDERFDGVFCVFRDPTEEEVRVTLPSPSTASYGEK